MATKQNPGQYDCYANAEPDEPMFVLLARDLSAEFLTCIWSAVKCGDEALATKLVRDAIEAHKQAGKTFRTPHDPKIIEANQCAKSMRVWRETKQCDAIEKRLAG